jgi:hypothetical protein
MIRLQEGDVQAFACPETQVVGVKWDRFLTHVAISDNKEKRNRYVKVGGNSIMYGGLTRFSRAIAVDNMHGYLGPLVDLMARTAEEACIDMEHTPWRCRMVFAAHLGYGSVGMRRTKAGWRISGGDDVQVPNWDLDNQWVWQKMFLDTCQLHGLLRNDTVGLVSGVSKDYQRVPRFEDRYMAFVFSPADLSSPPWMPLRTSRTSTGSAQGPMSGSGLPDWWSSWTASTGSGTGA